MNHYLLSQLNFNTKPYKSCFKTCEICNGRYYQSLSERHIQSKKHKQAIKVAKPQTI
jgi:hypothetical protein